MNFIKKLGTVALGGALMATLLIMPSAASAQSGKNKAPLSAPGISVSIDATGRALVRGAEITNISGSTLTAKMGWGNTALTWTVVTNGDTDVIANNGQGAALGDLHVGDSVSFSGSIDQSAGAFTVRADTVRNWSLTSAYAVFVGKVASVADASTTFVVATAEGTSVTVKANADTQYGTKDAVFTDVDVNDVVTVSGAYNSDTKVLTASRIAFLGGPVAAHGTGKGGRFNLEHFFSSFAFARSDKHEGKSR